MPQRTALATGLLPGPRAGGPHRVGGGASTVTLYVSPGGNDGNPGTLARPLASLDVARARVRLLPKGSVRVSVILRGGRYLIQQAVQFTLADSGTPGNPISYAAYPGEIPILSGGALVTNWTLANAARNLWTAQLPAGSGNPRTLYVGGVRYTRPRYPTPLNGGPSYNSSTGVAAMTTNVDWSTYTNPADMEIINQGSWSEYRVPITGLSGGGLNLTTPPVATQIFRGEYSIGATSLVENVFEYLAVGQFYVNRVARTVSCIPAPGVALSQVTCLLANPSVSTLINMAGVPGAPVHDIIFSGIQVSETGFAMDPTWGYSRIQAGVMSVPITETVDYYRLAPAAVEMLYTARVQVVGCVFTRLGSHGLKVGLGCVDSVVRGNLLFDISGVGMYLGYPVVHTSDADKTARLQVDNNVLHNVGVEFTDCPAIQQFGTADTVIAYNTITDTPWSSLATGIGWGRNPAPYQVNLQTHHNRIQRAMQVRQDGAAIYSNGSSLREQITDNAVTDSASYHGIYLDEGSVGKIVSRNAIYAIPQAYIFVYNPAGVNFLSGNLMDSLLINVSNGNQTPPGAVQVTSPQTVVPATDPAVVAVIAAAGVQPAYRSLLGKGAAV